LDDEADAFFPFLDDDEEAEAAGVEGAAMAGAVAAAGAAFCTPRALARVTKEMPPRTLLEARMKAW
jgi:hypothetical protein